MKKVSRRFINSILLGVIISLISFFVPKDIFAASVGDKKTFSCNNNIQTYTAPVSGYYQLETWGAQGGTYGNYRGGYGAYATGVVYLPKNKTIYVVVGGQPGVASNNSVGGGYNGGGSARTQSGNDKAGAGGGATHIALRTGVLSSLNSYRSDILIASGGGGGGYYYPSFNSVGGDAGGINGGIAPNGTCNGRTLYKGYAASQSGAGSNNACGGDQRGWYAGFGYGRAGTEWQSGGGAGFFGGGAGYAHGGNGGSSYIGNSNLLSRNNVTKSMYCYYCTTSTASNTYTSSTANVSSSPISKYAKSGSGTAAIKIVQILNSDARLSSIEVSGATLNEKFSSDTYQYTVNLDSENSTIALKATAINSTTKIVGTGTYDIKVGTTEFPITTTAEDGSTKVYKVKISRPASSYKYLKDIKIDNIVVPDFTPETLEYTIPLSYDKDEVSLSATLGRPNQIVDGLGKIKVPSGTSSHTISVTSEDKRSTTTYTLHFVREHSSKLKSLTIEGNALQPSFSSSIYDYTVNISKDILSLKTTGIAYDEEAKITYQGFGYIKSSTVAKVIVTEPHADPTEYRIRIVKAEVAEPIVYNFPYTGGIQTFKAPYTGYYQLETWGAQGGSYGNYRGGYGAYATGNVYLQQDEILYVVVGGQGGVASNSRISASYNGGGGARTQSGNDKAGGGGGATHIARRTGILSSLNSYRSNILMVSAGGGGGYFYPSFNSIGGDAGGISGVVAPNGTCSGRTLYKGAAASQSGAGANNSCGGDQRRTYAGFGYGRDGVEWQAGGGAGYFGGGAGFAHGGNGGSSYIGNNDLVSRGKVTKVMYCYSCTTSNVASTYTVSTRNYSVSPISYYAKSGSGYARISMAARPSTNNFLSFIKTDKGQLNPTFAMDEMNYQVALTSEEDTITISAALEDDAATMTGTGTFDVPAGTTDFPITVTAEDGSIRIYTVTVSRPASSNAKPHNITISGLVPALCAINEKYCKLDHEFDPDIDEYTLTVPSRIKNLEFTVNKGHKYQEVTGEGVHLLQGGMNEVVIEVTSEDKTNTKRYTYHIERDMTGNANIETLTVTNPKVDIHFDPDITDYYFSVPNEYTNVELQVTLEDPEATYKVLDNENFEIGLNQVSIEVTAKNGEVKTYILNIYREQSGNTFLRELTVSHNGKNYPLSPTFNKVISAYTVSVPNEVEEVLINGTAEHNLTTITGLGKKTLKTGTNTYQITTTAEDGSIQVYTISIIRAKDNDATLKTLDILESSLSPEFASNTLEYFIDVNPGVTSLHLNAIPTSPVARYEITGNQAFKLGDQNIVRITVIAEDGTKNIYSIHVNRLASTNNYLKDLNTDCYDLTSVFDKQKMDYDIRVPNDTTSIQVSAVAEDSLASVVGNKTYQLKTGDNQIQVIVTAEDGTPRTYTVNVYREYSNNANLISLSVNSEMLYTPVFDKDTLNYSLVVENDIKEISVVGIAEDSKATVKGNGTYQLNVLENTIFIEVTAENGDKKTYTLVVNRKKSSNANLSMLIVKESVLDPAFNKNIEEYTLKVLEDVTSLTIFPTLEDKNAHYEISGNENFEIGENRVVIKVIAEDGTEKEYILNVLRQEKGTASNRLLSLATSEGSLSPEFNSDTLYYEVEVAYSISEITVTGEAEDKNATVQGLGNHQLEVGQNVLGIEVTSAEGIVRSYQIVVKRRHNNEARLASLQVLGTTISPNFHKDCYEYHTKTKLNEFSIQATTIDPNATYEIIGNGPFDLGENQVIIRVTAHDKVTTKDYVIYVEKEKSNNNNLKSLTISNQEYTPEFSKTTTVYYLTVEQEIDKLFIEALPEDPKATVSGDKDVFLEVGVNYVEITVTSEAGSKKVYTLIVTRKGSSNAYLENLTVSSGSLSPTFEKTVNDYTVTVPYEIEEIQVDGTLEDSNAYVTGFDYYKLEVGDNQVSINVTAQDGSINIYTVHIIREEIVSSLLKELNVEGYSLEQKFSSTVFDYNITVDNETTSLDLKIVPIDPNATWEIVGNENFIVGMNEVKIIVTDRLKTSKTEYTLNVNRQSYANTYLAYIYPSKGKLNPEFIKDITSYTVEVENNIEEIKIEAEAELASNRVEGTGTYNLELGENKIELKVIAPNGIFRVYHVNVVRKKKSDNDLTNLEVKVEGKNMNLTPTFDKDTLSYHVTVPVATTNISILATASEKATITGDGNQIVHVGNNIFEVIVTAEDGSVKNYQLTVSREASNNNSLIDLIPSVGTLTPTFDYTLDTYTLHLDSSVSLLSFTAVTEDQFAHVTGIEKEVVPDGESTREIVVTAEDGSTKTYTVRVYKERTDEARLKSLKMNGYQFQEVFNSDRFQYTLTVPNNKNIILSSEIEAIPLDSNATITKTSSLVLSSAATNIYTIIVTAPDGFTTQTYTIAIERAKGSDSTLAKLAFNFGKMSPNFAPTTKEYTLLVPRQITDIHASEVEAIPTDDAAVVTMPDTFHYDSTNNTYQITVESPDKTSLTTYTVHLGLLKSSDATLKSLSLNEGKISPEFQPNTDSYQVEVRNDLEEITIDAIANDTPYAKVTSGRGTFPLTKDSTTFNIVVTAEDGTIKIYHLTINKSLPVEKYLQDLYLTGDCTKDTCPLSPTFKEETLSYKATVENEIETINIETIKSHNNQIVRVYDEKGKLIEQNNIFLKTGVNIFRIDIENGMGEITSYNLSINRKYSSNNYLKSLSIIDPEVELEFSKETYEYYVTIPSTYDKVQLEYEPEVITSEVKTHGTTYLNYGNNDVEVVVTAEDLSTRTYIIHVEREKGFNNYLQSLTVSSGVIYPLTPKFNKLTNHYIVTVPYNVASIQLDAVAEESTTTVSGVGEKNLKVGSNTFPITAVAKTGETLIYTVSINREKSPRLHLKQLDINNATRKEEFHKDRYTYTVDASFEVSKLDMTIVPELPDVTVKVIGNNNLKAGENTVLIILESVDKTTTTTYKLTVTKGKSSDNFLQSLKVEEEELITSSNMTETHFEVVVPKEKDQVLVTGVPRDKNATVVSGNGNYSLTFGSQSIILKVVSEEGETRDYEVVIKREYDLDLLMISTDRGELSPTFEKDTLEYTLEVDRTVEDITILAVSSSPLTTVTGQGYHTLELGENEILIRVEAADTSSKTYQLHIKRKLSDNNYIKHFSALGANVKEDFTRERLDYTLEVPNGTKSLDLEIELEEEHATYQVEGNENFETGDNPVQIKVTAEDGSVRIYNLTVSVQEKEKYSNRLLSLEVEGKTMNPVFDPDTMAYTVQVPYETTAVKVSGVLESVAATVTGFGTHSLNSGRNEISVVVTSKDNKVRVYTIIIERLQSSDARLKKIEFEECSFTLIFDKDITSYTIHLDSHITSLTEKVEPLIKGTTYEITGNKNIDKETKVVTIIATAADGITKKTYTFTLKHEKSTNNYLESLSSNIGTIQPEFEKTNSGPYEINVGENVQSIILTGKKESSTATVTGLGLHTLKKGQNIISIVVTSESGTQRTYTVIVNKALNRESELLSLSVSEGELAPTFDAAIFQYEVTVENSVSEIEVFAEAASKTAIITGDGLHPLDIGENKIEVVVTAEDGSISTYTILVTRKNLMSSKLLDIRAKEGRLLPEFSKNITDYTITVPNEVEALTLEITKEDPEATYRIEGNENFIVGSNEVKVIVTSNNQEETTYTLHVIRAPSANNYLKEITLSEGSLQPEFEKTEGYYEVEVPSTTTEITITGIAEDVTSTVTGNATYQLTSKENYVYLEVTSATGVSRVYTIKVTKHASSDNKLLSLIVTPGEMMPIFDPDHNNYEVQLEEGVTEITIDARAAATATISGIGTYPVKEGENHYLLTVTAEDGSINTYEIVINKTPSSNTNILNIIPSSGMLTPEYTPSIEQYQVEVEEDIAMINFDVLLESTTATVSGDKNNYLNYGSNNIEITVTAEDGTTKVVHIEVIRDKGITEIKLEDFLLMEVGDVIDLEPTLLPEDAINKELLWSIEDETIATVENGRVTAHRLGDTTLEICSKKNREVKKIVTISVLNLKITSEIYDVRRNVINLLDQDKIQNIVIGADEGETLDIFLSKLENKESLIKFYNIEGEAIEDLTVTPVTTGIIIRLEYQDRIYDQAYIAVRGENTQDGLINVDDFDVMINQVLGKLKYDSNHLLYKTMDTEENDEINVDDIDRLDQYILGKIKTLNEKKLL